MLINGRRLVPGDPALVGGRHQHHPRRADQARRRADRRRVVGVRCRRGCRRRQLRDGHGFRRLQARRPVFGLQPPEPRRAAVYRARSNSTRLRLPDAASVDRRRHHRRDARVRRRLRRRPRPHHGLCRLSQDQRGHCRTTATIRRARSAARTAAQVTANGQLYNCGGSATSAHGSFLAFIRPRRIRGGHSPRPSSSRSQPHVRRPASRRTISRRPTTSSVPTSATPPASSPITKSRDAIKPYIEFMFMDDRSVAQIAPSGDFGNTLVDQLRQPAAVGAAAGHRLRPRESARQPDAGNALTSCQRGCVGSLDGSESQPTRRRSTSSIRSTGATYNRGFCSRSCAATSKAARVRTICSTPAIAACSARRAISARPGSYDAYYQYGRTNFAETYLNDFSVTRLTRALDVVAGPAGGAPICRSALDGTDPNCVPYDIFSPGRRQPSQAASPICQTPGFQRGINSEQVARPIVAGSAGRIRHQVAVGRRGRRHRARRRIPQGELDFYADTAFQTGDLAGQGARDPAGRGRFNVKEVFAEVRMPIVQDSFIYDLTSPAAIATRDYSIAGGRSRPTPTRSRANSRRSATSASAAATTARFARRPCRICSHRSASCSTVRPIRARALAIAAADVGLSRSGPGGRSGRRCQPGRPV